MSNVIAETARLRLREWEEDDRIRFYERMNRPDVMQHLGGIQSFEEWEKPFERLVAMQRDYGHTFWVLEDRHSGAIAGFCGLKRVNSQGTDMTGQFEIGWRLHPDYWGKGIAKEAAIASLDLAFGTFAAPHVIALTVEGNRESWGLMLRLGMSRREDLDFNDPRYGPDLNPTIVYLIKATDWPAARAAALT